MPLISTGLFLLFLAIPKIDPLRQNIEKFRKHYDIFVAIVIAFLTYIHLLIVVWNMDVSFSLVQFLAPAFAILLDYCGILTENAKRNWFVGIRTPWTLSDERIWEKTHKTGGKLFKVAGAIALLGIIFQDYAVLFVLLPVILVAVYTVVYSYLEYQKMA